MLRTLDHVEAHAAATDDHHGVALADACGVDGRTETGEHTTPNERTGGERNVGVDLHRADGRDDRFLGERAGRGHDRDGHAVTGDARRHVEQPAAHRRHAADLAQLTLVSFAVEADAALGYPGHDDVVADAQVVDALAELSDGAGTFVAEHGGERNREDAVHD